MGHLSRWINSSIVLVTIGALVKGIVVIMVKKLWVLGVGPGDKDFILPIAIKKIEQCDVLIGGKRNLEEFAHLNKECIIIGNNLDEICTYIESEKENKSIAVLVSGDPGIYSMLGYLKGKLHGIEIEVIPGISSLQYLCSKLKLNWNDANIISLHGREQTGWIELVKTNRKVIIFAGGLHKPDNVCRELIKNNVSGLRVWVGQNLSYPNEKIIEGSLSDIESLSFDDLSLMILEHEDKEDAVHDKWEYTTPGIPDDLFCRGEVPMTKEEVRTISLSKLRLKNNSIVYDIGAGTGSVSIECALCCKSGKVYAFERNLEGIELIKRNAAKFGINNISIIEGNAPAVLNGLPEPDRIFIGGSGGNMGEILEYIKKLKKAVKLVINTVTVESTYEALEGLKNSGFKNIDIVNLAVSKGRAAGGKHLMQSQNPVYIISAEKEPK